MSATVRYLSDHRVARQPLRAQSVGPEAAECARLAERAAALLGVAEQAIYARGRYRPGIATLASESGGLGGETDA